jgi:hypothetical protein
MKRAAFSAIAACFLFAACGSDDEEPSRADCEAIFEACHPFDTGSGHIHECHESAESSWTPAQCATEKAGCLAACVASDAGSD